MINDYIAITEDAKKELRIGEIWGTAEYEITDLWLKKYAIATRDENPLWYDPEYAAKEGHFGYQVTPTCFATVLNSVERGEIMPQRRFFGKLYKKRQVEHAWGLAGGNEVECFETPIKVGDKIRCDIMVKDAHEKQGKDRLLVFVDILITMTNQDGAKVAEMLCTIINMYGSDDI